MKDADKTAGPLGLGLGEGLGAVTEQGEGTMRNLIRRIAKRAGCATSYHVAALYYQDSHMSTSTLSMTVTLRPWLHVDNYRELVEYLHTQATRPTKDMPVITSITKLGA